MRRSEREIKDRATIDEVLSSAFYMNLAMVDDGKPYVVPLNFGYADGCIYVHSAPAGRKVELLKRAPQVSFSVVAKAEVVAGEKPCQFSARYRSVLGTGRVVLVEDAGERAKGLDSIMCRFSKGPFEYEAKTLARTVIFRIDIESLSGKQAGY
jgi:nitroimidazol reductase NimA-like FMN-containing flavoprotein (pyridoxamine 5'-phosphate oxidase superfamily)